MTATEIRKMTDLAVKKCTIRNVSSKFMDTFRDFLYGIAKTLETSVEIAEGV